MEYGQSRSPKSSPRLIIQIVIVLHVSVILRAVADTCRVTLRPKGFEEADGERDGDGRAKDAWTRDGLVPSVGEIEEQRAGGD